MLSGQAVSKYPDMSARRSGSVLLSHPATGAGCEVSGWMEMSADRIPDVRYLGGWNVDGQDSGYEVSEWMKCRRTGFQM